MTQESVLLTEDRGAVRILTMNRPAKLNALDTALTSALLEALLAADGDESVRALVLTGGGRSFCAGADTSEFSSLTPENPEAVLARADLTTRLQAQFPRLKKPVVAAARGHALGGGAGLMLACDMVAAAPSLKLGYPEMAHGIVPAIVMTGLVRQLGPKPAFELIGLGKPIDAERALALGLINRIAEEDALLDNAIEIATRLAEVSPLAMRTTKELFYRVMELPYDQAMLAGRDANVAMRGFRKRKET
jgi:enoyl-CoA hydratase/carnithine racemase